MFCKYQNSLCKIRKILNSMYFFVAKSRKTQKGQMTKHRVYSFSKSKNNKKNKISIEYLYTQLL